MQPPSNRAWVNFVIAAISGISSFLVTFITIIGIGWSVHREIMSDVATLQKESNYSLEQKLSEKINSKLDREPSNYQIQNQESELRGVKAELQNTNSKIAGVESQLKEIKGLLKRNYEGRRDE